jgi:site-specific DNA-methyltransferase (adenine-specific)
MASDPDSVVVDPFGGSGTTLVAAELLGRRWVGIELECGEAVTRLKNLNADRENLSKIQQGKNCLFTQQALALRARNGFNGQKYRARELSAPKADPMLLALE